MQELNTLIENNLTLVIIGILALAFFLRKKEKAGIKQPVELDFDAGQDTATAEHEPHPQPGSLKTFITHWPEIHIIPLFVGIAVAINYALMQIWPDAIFLGPEHIQTILYKTIASFLAYFLFFLRDRLDFKEAWQWYTSPQRAKEHQELTPWQKRVTYFWRLSVFVLVFALV